MKLDRRVVEIVIAAFLVLACMIAMIIFFEQLPIEKTSLAIDWKSLYSGLQGGRLRYGTGLYNPPWSMVFVLPLGLLSFRASWGALTLMTLMVLAISVPRMRLHLILILFLVTSFPSLRHIADGNFEGLIIVGALLLVRGYKERAPVLLALGLLLVTAKPQEAWLLVVAALFYVLRTWALRQWLRVGGYVLVVIVPTMIVWGADWLAYFGTIQERGSIMDVSLIAALNRAELPAIASMTLWGVLALTAVFIIMFTNTTLSREKAALLIAISLLLSPYSAGNSYLTVLAVGVMPLFAVMPWLAAVMLLLANLPYLANREMLYDWQAYYWTLLLALTSIVCVFRIASDKPPVQDALNPFDGSKTVRG